MKNMQPQTKQPGPLHTPHHPIATMLPSCIKRALFRFYWMLYDTRDFLAEAVGWIPFHWVRTILWRWLQVQIGAHTSIHRNCRFYRPSGVSIGSHTVVNRNVLLDGRMGISIGNNVSISEGVTIFTLEHDLNDPEFKHRGGKVIIEDRVFIGAHALILPDVTLAEGAAIAAGAVVTHDVASYTIVAGVPARPIGQRNPNLTYQLDYKKIFG